MEFKIGEVIITKAIQNECAETPSFESQLLNCLFRHCSSDWGDLDKSDKQKNDDAVKNNDDRILSAYIINGAKIYIITDEERLYTHMMFADDY